MNLLFRDSRVRLIILDVRVIDPVDLFAPPGPVLLQSAKTGTLNHVFALGGPPTSTRVTRQSRVQLSGYKNREMGEGTVETLFSLRLTFWTNALGLLIETMHRTGIEEGEFSHKKIKEKPKHSSPSRLFHGFVERGRGSVFGSPFRGVFFSGSGSWSWKYYGSFITAIGARLRKELSGRRID